MMTGKQETGKKGEQIAMDFYRKQGYRLVATNWRYGHLEVDIIVENDQTIVFCEVKTRSSSMAGSPANFVDNAKQRHLIHAADHYVQWKRVNKEVRFDIIAILLTPLGDELEHIEGAFLPGW
ncbi:MAG: YraN family protein [Bacteroidales bacterium]|jgi:putative endonuclease|nr:YraN family protein [Bacteroidales bacterium]